MEEAGDMKAMREALSDIIDKINQWRTDGLMEHWQYSQLFDLANDALAKPPRNCDVGTAEEQAERYRNFAGRYNPCVYEGYARCAEDCPVHIKLTQEGHGELLCQLEWGHMPYTKGESDK